MPMTPDMALALSRALQGISGPGAPATGAAAPVEPLAMPAVAHPTVIVQAPAQGAVAAPASVPKEPVIVGPPTPQSGALGATAQGDSLTQGEKVKRDTANETELRDRLAQEMEHGPDMTVDTSASQAAGVLANQVDKNRETDIAANDKVAKEGIEAAKQEAKLNADIIKANQPAERLYNAKVQQSYDKVAEAEQLYNTQAKIAIDNYHQTQDEMRKMALEQPKDLFGRAGVNRMWGIAAVIVGGLGAEPHTNQALETVIRLSDRNITEQKNRFDMLSRVGESDKSMFAMIHDRLQDTTATENTMRNLALDVYKSNLQMTAGKYAGQQAQTFVAKETARIDDLQAKNNAAIDAHYGQVAAQQMQIFGAQQAAAVANVAAKGTQWQAHREQSIKGFVGYVPKAEHAKLIGVVGGARDMVEIGDEIKAMLQSGFSFQKIREKMIADVRFTKAAKSWLDTGARLEEPEIKAIDALKASDLEAFFTSVFGTNVNRLVEKTTAAQAAITAATRNYVETAAPNTIVFDNRDSLWGRFDPKVYKPQAVKDLAKQHKTTFFEKILAAAPAINESDAWR